MSARLTLLASVALLAAVPAAGAQERRVESRIDSVLAKRAALGIQLGSTGSLRDTLGVFVSRVTPKGPAENAGIIEGERIVSINGVDLRLNAADAGDSYASGLASRRLTRELQKASPGARVNLRVWSGGRVRDVQVTAGSAADLRGRGSLGFIFDGVPFGEGMSMLRSMPDIRGESFERLREIPGFRFEEMPRTRIDGRRQLRESFPRIRIERDGERVLHI